RPARRCCSPPRCRRISRNSKLPSRLMIVARAARRTDPFPAMLRSAGTYQRPNSTYIRAVPACAMRQAGVIPPLAGERRGCFMAQTNLPILSAEGGLSRYLQEIRKFPMLEPDEEFMLAKRYKEHGDPDAAQKLITSHLRLVAKIAMGYRGYGLPISEVSSAGNVGLLHAVKRFEPYKSFRLATYAMWCIRAAIQAYVLRSWSLVKIGTTAAQKRLFFNLRKIKGQIAALEDGNLHPDQIKQ